jgi:hypothetical protein
MIDARPQREGLNKAAAVRVSQPEFHLSRLHAPDKEQQRFFSAPIDGNLREFEPPAVLRKNGFERLSTPRRESLGSGYAYAL